MNQTKLGGCGVILLLIALFVAIVLGMYVKDRHFPSAAERNRQQKTAERRAAEPRVRPGAKLYKNGQLAGEIVKIEVFHQFPDGRDRGSLVRFPNGEESWKRSAFVESMWDIR